MALRWNWSDKMGEYTLVQKQPDGKKRKFTVNIYACNALAAFIYEYKANDGSDRYTLEGFFLDNAHVRRIVKSCGKPLEDGVKSIRLNIWYKEARNLMRTLTKYGYEVQVYYEPKKITIKPTQL